MQFLQESLIELITQTSTNLPPDVRQAMGIAMTAETGRRRRSIPPNPGRDWLHLA